MLVRQAPLCSSSISEQGDETGENGKEREKTGKNGANAFASQLTSFSGTLVDADERPFLDIAVAGAVDAIDDFRKTATASKFSKPYSSPSMPIASPVSPGDLKSGSCRVDPSVENGDAYIPAVTCAKCYDFAALVTARGSQEGCERRKAAAWRRRRCVRDEQLL